MGKVHDPGKSPSSLAAFSSGCVFLMWWISGVCSPKIPAAAVRRKAFTLNCVGCWEEPTAPTGCGDTDKPDAPRSDASGATFQRNHRASCARWNCTAHATTDFQKYRLKFRLTVCFTSFHHSRRDVFFFLSQTNIYYDFLHCFNQNALEIERRNTFNPLFNSPKCSSFMIILLVHSFFIINLGFPVLFCYSVNPPPFPPEVLFWRNLAYFAVWICVLCENWHTCLL